MRHEPGARDDTDQGAPSRHAPVRWVERGVAGDLSGRLDRLSGVLGLGAVAVLGLGLTPEWTLPAWPAVTVGALALLCALPAGRPGWRGIGAFFGLVGLVGGALQIAGLWYLVFRLGA